LLDLRDPFMERHRNMLSKISGEAPDNCSFLCRSFARLSRKGTGYFFIRSGLNSALCRELPMVGAYIRVLSLRLRAEYPGTGIPSRLVAGAPFSHSTSPAMVTTSLGIAATVEEGTAPKPVQVKARVQRNSGEAYFALRRNCLRQDSWYRSPMTAPGASIYR
jgi:hypothetical protein